jgi:alpha-glucosidase
VTVIANAGDEAVALPGGTVLVASGPLAGDTLPVDTAVWIATA